MTKQEVEHRITESLEKGRRPDPIGTRKIQEKTEKDGSKIRYWRKKTGRGWEYDGLVSEAEYKAFMASQRKAKKLTKLKEETKKKIAEKKEPAKKKDDKPTDAEIDKMPTKQQMYWRDPNVTESRRKLADVTGILTLDDNSENYVRARMNTVFSLSSSQQDTINGVDLNFPIDADGKAFDDPLFLEDSAEALNKIKQTVKSESYQKQMENDLKKTFMYLDSYVQRYTYDDDVDKFIEKGKESLDLVLDMYTDAIENHTNDQIVAGKIAAFDKGIRGLNAADSFDSVIVQSVFGSLLDKDGSKTGEWDTLPESYQKVLRSYGLNGDKWAARKWGNFEAYAFALASVNDSFRNSVLIPWLELWGNVVYEKYTKTVQGWNGTTQEITSEIPKIAAPNSYGYIDVSDASVEVSAQYARKNVNKRTADFINKSFLYQGLRSENATQRRDDLLIWAAAFPSSSSPRFTQKGVSIRDHIRSLVSTDMPTRPVAWGLKQSGLDWRTFANELKAASKRKGFDTSTFEEVHKAIADLGKALGTTPIGNTGYKVEGTFRSFHGALTKAMKTTIRTPESEDVNNVVSPELVRTYTNDGPRQTHPWVSRFFSSSYGANISASDDKKTGVEGFVSYRQFRKSSSKWKSGNEKWSSVPVGSNKGVKASLRSKFVSELAKLAGRYDRSKVGGMNAHVASSLTMQLGLNWQLRKITQNEDVIPDFQINPKFMPFSKTNPLSRTGFQGATVQGSYIGPRKDGSGNYTDIDSNLFNEYMTEHYKSSVAADLGIGMGNVQTAGRGKPKIVLKTNSQPLTDWQRKIDSDWTHHKTGNWSRGSVQVNNVFDIMYHDYFDDYKKIEQSKGNVDYMYHGTDFKAAALITKGGYIVPKQAKAGRMLGDGVYFAKSSSKSAGYLRSSGWNRGGDHGVLLWNRVAKGVETDPKNPNAGIRNRSIDTVYAGGQTGANQGTWLGHDEWCVKNPKACVPIQWIDVQAR